MFGIEKLRWRVEQLEDKVEKLERDKFKADRENEALRKEIDSIKTNLNTLVGLVNAQVKKKETAEKMMRERNEELFGGLNFPEALYEMITGREVKHSDE